MELKLEKNNFTSRILPNETLLIFKGNFYYLNRQQLHTEYGPG